MKWPWISRKLHLEILEVARRCERELAEAQLAMERRKLDEKYDEVNRLISNLILISVSKTGNIVQVGVSVTRILLIEMQRSNMKDELFAVVTRKVVQELNGILA